MIIFTVTSAFTGIFYWLFYSVYLLGNTSIYVENGPLENIQVFTIIISCIAFLLALSCKEKEAKLIGLFLSFLCLCFLLREVDVERLDIPSIFIFIGSGASRNIILSLGLLAIATYASFNMDYYKAATRKFFSSIEGALIIAAAALLVVGSIFEKSTAIPHYVFLEELFELMGYVAILISALVPLQKPTCYSNAVSD